MLPYIDLQKQKERPKLWLCKPNLKRTVIAPLTDIYNLQLNTRVNSLSELSFDIPIKIERNHELINNPILEKFKGLYYVKLKKENGQIEYFISSKHSGTISDDGIYKSFHLYSLGHQLNNKIIRKYEEDAKTLTQHALQFLSKTNWSLGGVDAEFDLKYRTISISSATVLQCLYDLAELFGAYIDFDTVNNRVNFYNPQKIGNYKGLTLKEGFYLETLDIEFNYDDIVTRLYVYGQDDLEIRRLSPTGMPYLEDFTWFMYPFECDDNYNVIKSSYYMSDELCIALTKYNKLLKQKEGVFDNLVNQRTEKEDELQQKEQELSVLETELKIYYNELDVINATYEDNAPTRNDYKDCMNRINNKKSQIANKENEIIVLQNELEDIEVQINNLRSELKTENNFTPNEIMELNNFIREKDFTNSSIVDEEDLLKEGKEQFKQLSIPTITLSIGLANFLGILENDPNRNKLILGDIVRFKSKSLNETIEARISEINRDYENDSISITVTNTKNIKTDEERVFEMIEGSARAATTVDMDKFKWDKAYTTSDDVSKVLASTFDATLHGIKAGAGDSIIVNERGLYSTSVQDPNAKLVIQGGVLAISPDNLNTLSVAINKNGVFADKLHGRMLIGNKLHIETETGIINLEGSTETIFDNTGKKRVELGRYVLDGVTKYGLNIIEGAIDIRTSATSNRGVQLDSNGFRAFNNNGVKTFDINSVTGEVSIIGSMNIKTSSSTNRGVVFDGNGISAYNASGTRTFYVDTNGNFTANTGTFTGIMNATGGTISGNLTITGSLNGGKIKGSIIDGGRIEGTTIETDKNLYVGDYIYLGNQSVFGNDKRIYFNNKSYLQSDGNDIAIIANRYLDFVSGNETTFWSNSMFKEDVFFENWVFFDNRVVFSDIVNFSDATVIGLTAEFAEEAWEANRLQGYRASDFVIADTSGLSIGYSSAARRMYLRVNGTNVGYIDFDNEQIGT